MNPSDIAHAPAPLGIPPGLKRYPERKGEALQAWDGADELVLQHLSQHGIRNGDGLELKGARILVVGDSFGALSCALQDCDLTVYTDSYISYQAIQLNSAKRIHPLRGLNELSGLYDLVLIKLPKNMSFFEDILAHLSGHLHPASTVICGYMLKHQANASFELMARYIGETSTSLARKKARLIFARFQRAKTASPYPIEVPMPRFEIPFVNHSNLFSREKLDIGTRFFLEHLPQGSFKTILDLGCANGIIGIAAKKLNPAAEVIFSDESSMAIQSAMANYRNCFADQPGQARFLWTHCYENQEPGSVDLVLCNPPFHQGNRLDDLIARQMFRDAHRALTPGGKLRVIGNWHLQYPGALARIFGQSEIIARHPKFVIVDAIK